MSGPIKMGEPVFLGREREYVTDVLDTRQLSMGKYVSQFERLICRSMEARHAVAVTSGTTALHLALLSLGVVEGDRVVVPACSYVATANAVKYCGATPVFADVDVRTWTIDKVKAEYVARASGASIIIVVHLYGVASSIPSGKILEDSCEAHGMPLQGDVAVLSFYGNKIITCGEGGAVVTNNREVAAECQLLRGQGTSGRRRYLHERLGYNYRMTDLQAAIGLAQMEKLQEHLQYRAELAAVYEENLVGIPRQHRPTGSINWVMPILVDERDRVAQELASVGIETRPVFPSLPTQPYLHTAEFFPVAEDIARRGLLLPLHLGMNASDVVWICHTLRRVVNG